MKIQIIQIGKYKNDNYRELADEFEKRLSAFADVSVTTLKGADGALPRERIIEDESRMLLGALEKVGGGGGFLVVLDDAGKQFDSVGFSEFLGKRKDNGDGVIFVIGGAFGLTDELKGKADLALSLSKMTFTHQMVRPLLMEQIYRGFCILNGKEYHY
ncbi:23S rRNA (pseudouridine(1915)-N(3))-methyltransferase RlmH [Candidatus Peregrinibacteria bacterium]|nr:23S rRNA (pseudouridine(1915)-N(3))-methyltransferase RlmH [Candidatus Peregrinibacteria bacterium]MBT4056070.1 23S rRNA (pseudouridine(1915)-N(3))-methyltransferase RlmH [Candidatus Peregrinibacteria bacterium]